MICGESGSGKSTLLKLIKSEIAPYGEQQGQILYKRASLEEYSAITKAQNFGLVFQNPDHQMVLDNVKDELIFGLENLGYSTSTIRKKIAEVVQFFGLKHLLDKKTDELSGGEKQTVNLASVLAMGPEILLLDEPTGQLDPIAAKDLLTTLEQINKEFGTTILIVEHRLEELFSTADKVLILEDGKVAQFGKTREVLSRLDYSKESLKYLPQTTQLYLSYTKQFVKEEIPLSVKEAKNWLEKQIIIEQPLHYKPVKNNRVALAMSEVDFQYHQAEPPVLSNLNFSAYQNEVHAILGANGSGKTTLLNLIAQIKKPQHGKIIYDGIKKKKISLEEVGYLPQNPATFFMYETVIEEYQAIAKMYKLENASERIDELLERFGMTAYKNRHPYDLSGGQLQKVALIGSLLVRPNLLLVDEPTKGLDPLAKKELGQFFEKIAKKGTTIIMVTHDIEFAAKVADQCSMLFEGQIISTETTHDFFMQNMYYTTIMNRITREYTSQSLITLGEVERSWSLDTPNISS